VPPVLSRVAAAALGALALAGGAHAATVEVVVVPASTVESRAGDGAVALMPPSDSGSVSRAGAIAALVRGKTRKSLLGGHVTGKRLIELGRKPGADVSILVSLPPTGKHANDRRYPVAIVGGRYRGLLTSPSTRLAGLVSIADIAPTAVSLSRGEKPRLGSTAGTLGDLETLDMRLRHQQSARNWSVAILTFAALALSLLGLALSSARLTRAGLLGAPLAFTFAVVLSGFDVTRPAILLPTLAVLTVGVSIAGGALLSDQSLAWAFVGLIAAYLVVLAAKPTWAALAAIGPNPSEGGRFYGSSNLTTSILLTIALFTAGALGRRSVIPVALLSIVTVGWSRAGADGGGIVVLVAAFAALWILLSNGRLTARALALAGALAVGVGLALVGLDAATGGSSHVTRKVGDGPIPLLDELGDRLHISIDRLTTSWHAALVFAIAIVALFVLFTRPPRFAVGDALMVGIAVSLLINDTPQHVAAAGAVSYGVLWAHERVVSLSDGPQRR